MRDRNTGDLFAVAYGNDEPRERLVKERRAAEREVTAIKGMVRRRDRATSEGAARVVQRRKGTIREEVAQWAERRGWSGFTDDELKIYFEQPGRPESSYRKRRSELTEENIILDTGRTRKNRSQQDETVWVHHLHAQPGAKKWERPAPSTKKAFMRAALERALPVLIEAGADPALISEIEGLLS